jgi:hypothetical protein
LRGRLPQLMLGGGEIRIHCVLRVVTAVLHHVIGRLLIERRPHRVLQRSCSIL